jgi:hypothetical protein
LSSNKKQKERLNISISNEGLLPTERLHGKPFLTFIQEY